MKNWVRQILQNEKTFGEYSEENNIRLRRLNRSKRKVNSSSHDLLRKTRGVSARQNSPS